MASPAKSPKKGKDMYMWFIVGAVVFLIGYIIFTRWCGKTEGLDASTQYLMNTVGGSYNTQQLMETSVPSDFASVSKHTLAEDDALNYYNATAGDAMRIGKSLAFQDAMDNRYTKLKEMMY